MKATMKRAWAVAAFWLMAMLTTAAGAGTITYYHNDLAGSPAVATDASGQVIWRESYRPYGERLTNAPASSTNDVWFTSRRQDQETGLVYMGARYYDPVAGRFISTDPKGFDEANIHSFNRYAYANNNPYRYTDPDGKLTQPLFVAVSALTIGTIYVATTTTREQRARAVAQLAESAQSSIQSLRGKLSSLIYSEGAKGPEIPDRFVGSQDDKSGTQGNRQNSGPLDTQHGGTGDPKQDFDKLTGGKSNPAPPDSNYPPGTLIGENGIALRPEGKESGARIDIPSNGSKAHETLHY